MVLLDKLLRRLQPKGHRVLIFSQARAHHPPPRHSRHSRHSHVPHISHRVLIFSQMTRVRHTSHSRMYYYIWYYT